jgi:hypothetical protein
MEIIPRRGKSSAPTVPPSVPPWLPPSPLPLLPPEEPLPEELPPPEELVLPDELPLPEEEPAPDEPPLLLEEPLLTTSAPPSPSWEPWLESLEHPAIESPNPTSGMSTVFAKTLMSFGVNRVEAAGKTNRALPFILAPESTLWRAESPRVDPR